MPKGPTKTSMDSLLEAAENDYTGRARRISSVSRSIDNIEKNSRRHVSNLSDDVSSLAKRQKIIENRLRDVEDYTPEEKQMKSASNSILKNVNLAMITLASGMKKITTTTAGALKDAVGDYGRAISEDFSINKQNLTAMALSRISPVFGYFVSKFMQTDVYRRAISRISESMHNAMSAIGNRFKGFFHIGGKSNDQAIESFTKKMPKRPRKMQAGGYVQRGGLAQVHAAEVIMPIDRVLERLDRGGGNEIQREMLASLEDLNIHMRTFSDSYRKDVMHRKGLIGDFIRSLFHGEYGRSWEMQMLFLQKEMRDAMVDQSKYSAMRLEEAIEVTMRRHPTFRVIMRTMKWIEKSGKFLMWTIPIKAPFHAIKWAFGKRDKYSAALGRALGGTSPFSRIENVLTLIYTAMAPNLDRLNAIVSSIGANVYNLTVDKLGPSKAVQPKYDIITWTRTAAFLSALGAPMRGARAVVGGVRAAGGRIYDVVAKRLASARLGVPESSLIKDFNGEWIPKPKQIEGPKEEKKKFGIFGSMKELVKIRKASEKTAEHTGSMLGKLKKFGSDLWFYLGLGFNMISSVLSMIPGFGSIMTELGGLAKGVGSGIWSVGKFLLTKMIMPIISSLGTWVTGLLSSVGLTGLASTLGTSLGTLAAGGVSGIGTILIGTIAAGIIGYGIGWAINKLIDWIGGEEGSIGNWLYDKLNPMVNDQRVSLLDQAWTQIKEWSNIVVGYVVWPFQKAYELTKTGIAWIWEQIQKIPGISTVLEWGSKAYGGAKDFLTKPYFEGAGEMGTGNEAADSALLRKSRIEQAKEYARGKKKQILDAAEFTKEFSSASYNVGMKELASQYERAKDPKTKQAIWEKIQKLKNEYQEKTRNKVTELKQKGIDMTAEQRAAVDAKLAENEQIINQIRESTKSFSERVSEGYSKVQRTVVSTANNIMTTNNNMNNIGPSESRFTFGSGDKHASVVLQCNSS